MLIVEDLLKNMKKHFPRWMDIRRKTSSSGSILLESIAEETADIAKAIEDYKKDFFLNKYINNEDSILTFIYKATIGITEQTNIVLINPDIEIVTNQEDFYSKGNVCLYLDGVIYFKNNYDEVQYAIEGYKSSTALEKIHVWNVFDEFAVFVGLRRYQWEDNKELLNRILSKSNKTINSSEDGLKEALLTNLINIAPTLSKEDILIERPTPENLIKYYDEFNNILDHLNNVNRDVYKNKKWDIDTWNFSIKSIDYLPHAWDVVLDSYINGIGDNDDLKVEIINNTSTTDATLSFYKKSKTVVNSYMKNNNIQEKFKLELIKYKNDLNPDDVKYKISASEVEAIDVTKVLIKVNKERIGSFDVAVTDIIASESFHYAGRDYSSIDSKYIYNLKFTPINRFEDFRIDKLSVETYKENSIVEEKPDFIFTDKLKKCIRYKGTLRYIIDEYQCSLLENMYKTINGFESNDLSKESKMKININGCANEPIYYEYEIKQVPLLFNNIEKNNCYIKDGYIVPDISDDEKYITIDTYSNSLSMTIEGPFSMEYSINNNGIQTISDFSNKKFEFSTDRFNMPQNMKLKIKLNASDCKISNIMYSKYDFYINTEKGDFNNKNAGSLLPSYDLNNLIVTIKTYTGFSPIIKYIYIGTPIPEDISYEISYNPNQYYYGANFRIESNNCKLQLSKISKSDGSVVEVIDNYSPCKHYGLTYDDHIKKESRMKLDNIKERFCEIKEIKVEGGKIEKINSENGVEYILVIPLNTFIGKVNVTGKMVDSSSYITLEDIIKRKGYSTGDYSEYSYYVTKTSDELIAFNRLTRESSYISITRNDFFDEGDYSSITIECNQHNFNDIQPRFIERDVSNPNLKTVTNINTFDGYFDIISFAPMKSDIYVAINSYSSIYPTTKNIKIVNTFTKGFDEGNRMFYIIESLNNDYNVTFNNNMNKSLDEKTITISRKNYKDANYNYEKITIEEYLALGTSVELPSVFILPNQEQLILDKYIITNYDNVSYITKENSDNVLDFLKIETIYTDNTGFNKLEYSNIHEIESISISKNGSTKLLIENVDFIMLYQEGIIVWKEANNFEINSEINIRYYIKKAASIEFDIDNVYKKIQYNVDSLDLIDQIKLEKISINQQIDLNLYEAYKDTDLTSIHCSEPGFIASTNNNIIKFSTTVENNTIAVKSGFYYMDGNEYYMFANNNLDNIEKIDNVHMKNVTKENKVFSLKQQTTNFISNSSMRINSMGEIFDLNCIDKEIETISKLNSITACENFNYWNSIASNLAIAEGINGQGIHFTSMNDINGYIYIPISNLLTKEGSYILSFFLLGEKAEAYIGEERIVYSVNSKFNQESVIDILSVIKESNIEKNVFEIEFEKKEDNNYFLIISNTGIIDDVIIVAKKDYEQGMHKKNIDYLKLNIEENIYAEYSTRLYLSEEGGATFDGTEIKDKVIINSSYIQWGFTSIKKLDNYEEFKKCLLTNVDLDQYNNKCIVKTGLQKGLLTTNSIYIGNIKTVKNFLFKINNVMFNNMKGFKVKILTSNNASSGFKEVSQHIDNIGCISGDKLLSYVKLMVEMPSNKVITNIELFIEYLSDDISTPSNMSVLSGTYMSKVLDAQYNERFLIKNISISENNNDIQNYIFQVRASRQNDEKTTWTDWKTIELKNNFNDILDDDIIENGNISNRLVFDGYRFFQFKLILKGENSSIKINYIDLEVI